VRTISEISVEESNQNMECSENLSKNPFIFGSVDLSKKFRGAIFFLDQKN
jgi:hypothetical protein